MNLLPVLKQRYLDANGNPLAGGKLYSYQAGTTTPQATYTDSGGLTANANPVVLDANGEANVWVDPELSYKFVLKNSSDATQWTVDNVIGLLTNDSVGTNSLQDDSVTTVKILDDAVTAAKLRDDASIDGNRAVTTNHIRDLAITTAKINDLAVTTGKINDLAVTVAKIGTGALTADATGRGKMADGYLTQAKLASRASGTSVAAGGVAIAASSVIQTISSGSETDVTNQSVTIVTTGRPVRIFCQSAGSGSDSHFGALAGCTLTLYVYRDSTKISQCIMNNVSASNTQVYPPGVLDHIDSPAAGTYTYKLVAKNTTNNGSANHITLVAYEL
jgi:hypothetical protein